MHTAQDYSVKIWYSAVPGDDCYVAQVVGWPGIMAHGETRAEAAEQIQLALEGALEILQAEGQRVPEPVGVLQPA